MAWTVDPADPAGRQGGLNLFEYCASNPVRLVDPNGLAPLPAHLQNIPDTGLSVPSVQQGLADLATLAETETTQREYTLVRDGKAIKIIRGLQGEVTPAPGQTIIAHTHPNAFPLPTMSDIATMMKQRVGRSLIVTKQGQWACISIDVKTGGR